MLSLYNSLPEEMSPLRETTSLFSIKNNPLSSETNLTGHTESELVVSFLFYLPWALASRQSWSEETQKEGID